MPCVLCSVYNWRGRINSCSYSFSSNMRTMELLEILEVKEDMTMMAWEHHSDNSFSGFARRGM